MDVTGFVSRQLEMMDPRVKRIFLGAVPREEIESRLSDETENSESQETWRDDERWLKVQKYMSLARPFKNLDPRDNMFSHGAGYYSFFARDTETQKLSLRTTTKHIVAPAPDTGQLTRIARIICRFVADKRVVNFMVGKASAPVTDNVWNGMMNRYNNKYKHANYDALVGIMFRAGPSAESIVLHCESVLHAHLHAHPKFDYGLSNSGSGNLAKGRNRHTLYVALKFVDEQIEDDSEDTSLED